MKSLIKSTKGAVAVLCLLSLAACGGGSTTIPTGGTTTGGTTTGGTTTGDTTTGGTTTGGTTTGGTTTGGTTTGTASFAGTYDLLASDGTIASATFDSTGNVTSCSVGTIVFCSGSLAVDSTTGNASFTISGNDGIIDTTATLTGTITAADGSVSGSYTGYSLIDGWFSGTFTGSRVSGTTTGGTTTGGTTTGGTTTGGTTTGGTTTGGTTTGGTTTGGTTTGGTTVSCTGAIDPTICESVSGITATYLTAMNDSCTSLGGTTGTGCSAVGLAGHCDFTDPSLPGMTLSYYFYDSTLASFFQAECTASTANGGLGGTWVP